MDKITVSAPGKLMLFGEHGALYNHPCIVTAVDRRMKVTAEITDSKELQIDAGDVGIKGYRKEIGEIGKGKIPKGAKFIETAVKNILCHPELACPPNWRVSRSQAKRRFLIRQLTDGMTKKTGIKIKARSEFSSKLGFGSSSAVTVGVIKAVSELLGLKLTKKEMFDLSYKTVLDIQKKGSGFDIAAAIFGGTLYFLTGGKVIKPLSTDNIPLVVGYTNKKVETVEIIDQVKKRFSKKQKTLDAIYEEIEKIVNKAKKSLVKKDWVTLGKLMNANQDYLNKLGVSSAKIDDIITEALKADAYGAKLSGAGGGDCIIFLSAQNNRKSIESKIGRSGGQVISVKTSAEGVRIEA
jgi:mevalonate kinase